MPPARDRIRSRLHAYAASLPEATEDHPWEELVYKVNKKIFVFFGSSEEPGLVGFSLKLPESAAIALTFEGFAPTGYGLGRAGWVSGTVGGTTGPPVEVVEDWIEESYRAVAPKRLVRVLDERAEGAR